MTSQGSPVIRARLEKEWLTRLHRVMREDGYETISEYIRAIVKRHIMKKEREIRGDQD